MLIIRRHPWSLIFDATAKTNSRNLPWIFCVGQDSNGWTILWGACIYGAGELSNNSRWLLGVALFGIYGRILIFVSLNTTDGDFKEYTPLEECIKNDIIGGCACRCFWHHHTQRYTVKILPGAKEEEKQTVHLPIQRAVNELRLHAETTAEIKDIITACRAHLNDFLSNGSTCGGRVNAALEHVTMLEGSVSLFVKSLFGPRAFGGGTGARAEGENACLKLSPAVHSRADLEVVYMQNKTRLNNRRLTRDLEDDAYAYSAPAGNKHLEERMWINTQLGNQAKLVKKGEELLTVQLIKSRSLEVYDCSSGGILSFKTRQKGKRVSDTYNDGIKRLWNEPERERTVTLRNGRLQCDCPFPSEYVMLCCDVLAVTRERFSLRDIHIIYLQAYNMGTLDDVMLNLGQLPPSTFEIGIHLDQSYDIEHPIMTESVVPYNDDVIFEVTFFFARPLSLFFFFSLFLSLSHTHTLSLLSLSRIYTLQK